MKLLEVKHLSKLYGEKHTAVQALDDVSFSVDKGEFISIVGPSGSGKSTLLHIISGIEDQTSGEVLLDGVDIQQLPDHQKAILRRRHIGLVFQQFNLVEMLNVQENITLPLDLESQEMSSKYLEELLDVLGLASRRYFLPHQCSGGTQQRVAIARALAPRPTLILADEPTGHLDSYNSQQIMELFLKANREYNQTILLITHNMELALMADRLIYLQDGKIVKDEKLK